MGRDAAMRTVIGLREKGELDGIGPNAMVFRLMGASLVAGRMPREVRAELAEAVKLGKLGHIKKEGLRPEVFFHPNARSYAIDLREAHFRQAVNAIRGVCASPELDP